jgi:uncharacterized RDD family membrane protein YckC
MSCREGTTSGADADGRRAPHDGRRAGPAAGMGRRLASMAYDWLLLLGLWFCGTWLLLLLRGGEAIAPGTWWFGWALVSVSFVFFGGFWTHGGQTLGMRAWRLRVERSDGHPLRWREALIRYLAAAFGILALGLGFASALLDPERRCWHDRLSRTRLVRLDR